MSVPGLWLQRLQRQVAFSWFAWAFQFKEEVSRIRFSTEFSRIRVGCCMFYWMEARYMLNVTLKTGWNELSMVTMIKLWGLIESQCD